MTYKEELIYSLWRARKIIKKIDGKRVKDRELLDSIVGQLTSIACRIACSHVRYNDMCGFDYMGAGWARLDRMIKKGVIKED